MLCTKIIINMEEISQGGGGERVSKLLKDKRKEVTRGWQRIGGDGIKGQFLKLEVNTGSLYWKLKWRKKALGAERLELEAYELWCYSPLTLSCFVSFIPHSQIFLSSQKSLSGILTASKINATCQTRAFALALQLPLNQWAVGLKPELKK